MFQIQQAPSPVPPTTAVATIGVPAPSQKPPQRARPTTLAVPLLQHNSQPQQQPQRGTRRRATDMDDQWQQRVAQANGAAGGGDGANNGTRSPASRNSNKAGEEENTPCRRARLCSPVANGTTDLAGDQLHHSPRISRPLFLFQNLPPPQPFSSSFPHQWWPPNSGEQLQLQQLQQNHHFKADKNNDNANCPGFGPPNYSLGTNCLNQQQKHQQANNNNEQVGEGGGGGEEAIMNATGGEKASPTTLASRRRFACCVAAEAPRPPLLEHDLLLGSAAFSARRSAAVGGGGAATANSAVTQPAPPFLSNSMSCGANLSRICGGTNAVATTPTGDEKVPTICPSSSSSTSFLTSSCSANAIDQLQAVAATQIFDFLFLGSQNDALNAELLKRHGITRVINLSETGPAPSTVPDDGHHFLRIPIKDSYSAKLLPHFDAAFEFIEAARASGHKVLVHCLAGISRSPTLVIAYVMRAKQVVSDEAYKFVKNLRPTISPNFNFLGQLMEFEKLLRDQKVLPKHQPSSSPSPILMTNNNNHHQNANAVTPSSSSSFVVEEKKPPIADCVVIGTGVEPSLSSQITTTNGPATIMPSPALSTAPPAVTAMAVARPRQLISTSSNTTCPPPSARFSCPPTLFPRCGTVHQQQPSLPIPPPLAAGVTVPSPSTEFARLDLSLANPCFGLLPAFATKTATVTTVQPQQQSANTVPVQQQQQKHLSSTYSTTGQQTKKLERQLVPSNHRTCEVSLPQNCENPIFDLMIAAANNKSAAGGKQRQLPQMANGGGTKKQDAEDDEQQKQQLKRTAPPPPPPSRASLARFSTRACLPMPSEQDDDVDSLAFASTEELFRMGGNNGIGRHGANNTRSILNNAIDDDEDNDDFDGIGVGRGVGGGRAEKRSKKMVVVPKEDHNDDDDGIFAENGGDCLHHFVKKPSMLHAAEKSSHQQSATKMPLAGGAVGGRQLLSNFRHHFQPNRLLSTFAHNNSSSPAVQQQQQQIARHHRHNRLHHQQQTSPIVVGPTSSSSSSSSAPIGLPPPKRKYHHHQQVHRLLMASLGMRRNGGANANNGTTAPTTASAGGGQQHRRRRGTHFRHHQQQSLLPTVPDIDDKEEEAEQDEHHHHHHGGSNTTTNCTATACDGGGTAAAEDKSHEIMAVQ
ncbi:hypothetical protein niasHT_010629 [Heterodera trifolii]|uniref:protein-tyrosine-phosphatase n=1 Tax=Heterodera trifolii TaxID=157864 RepID=A0ABD2L910_9BILA